MIELYLVSWTLRWFRKPHCSLYNFSWRFVFNAGELEIAFWLKSHKISGARARAQPSVWRATWLLLPLVLEVWTLRWVALDHQETEVFRVRPNFGHSSANVWDCLSLSSGWFTIEPNQVRPHTISFCTNQSTKVHSHYTFTCRCAHMCEWEIG